jgi:hypothetical protein
MPQEVQEEFRAQGFEPGMKLVHERFGQAVPQLMREMAVYFVQFRPFAQQSLYCRLVRDLKQANILSRVTFSSLNYECVLEYSLLEAGVRVEYFPENLVPDMVPVFKLHGSCNMFAHGIQAGQGVLYGTGVTWEGGAQAFFDSNRVAEHCLVETGLAPMMSLYMQGKPLNVSPSVIKQVQKAWADGVSTAKAVFVVGVRPLPTDDHVWAPLAETPASLYFVGDTGAFSEWVAAARDGRPSFQLGTRFNESYFDLLDRVQVHGAN